LEEGSIKVIPGLLDAVFAGRPNARRESLGFLQPVSDMVRERF
jgi:hypothetical protein